MRAVHLAALMCLLMVVASIPQYDQTNTEFAETSDIFQSNSDIAVTFSNGPTNGQSLTGVYTLSFSITGSNTVASLVVEISDDGSNLDKYCNPDRLAMGDLS